MFRGLENTLGLKGSDINFDESIRILRFIKPTPIFFYKSSGVLKVGEKIILARFSCIRKF